MSAVTAKFLRWYACKIGKGSKVQEKVEHNTTSQDSSKIKYSLDFTGLWAQETTAFISLHKQENRIEHVKTGQHNIWN